MPARRPKGPEAPRFRVPRRTAIRADRRGGCLDGFRRPEAGERSAAQAYLHSQRSHPAHQHDARSRHRARGGGRERPRAHRRPPRRRRHRRRRGDARGLPPLRPHPGAGAGDVGHARRQCPPVRAPARAARTPAGRRPAGLLRLARHRALAGALPDLAGHPDAPPRRRCRQLLPRRKGGRSGVHRRGRGGAGAVRGPGRGGDRQRPHAPRRAAGAGRPRGPRRDLAGRGRGSRCPRRPYGLAQPRGAAHRREPADPRPSDRAA